MTEQNPSTTRLQPQRWTLANLAGAYVQHLASMRYSAGTVRKTRGFLRNFVGWCAAAGVETPERLQAGLLRQWHERVVSLHTARGRPLKPATVNRHFIAVRGWLEYLASQGYVHRALLEALPYVKEPRLLPGSVLGHEQMRGLLDAIPTDTEEGYRNRTMLELLYSTGIRVGELLGLDVDSVDFTNRVIQVMGKGEKQRVAPVGRTAFRFLEGYVAAVRPFLAPDGRQRALFVNRAGRRVSYPAFLRLVHGGRAMPGLTRTSPRTPSAAAVQRS